MQALSEVNRVADEVRRLIKQAENTAGSERRRLLDRAYAQATYLEEYALHHGIIERRELRAVPRYTSTSTLCGVKAVSIYGGHA